MTRIAIDPDHEYSERADRGRELRMLSLRNGVAASCTTRDRAVLNRRYGVAEDNCMLRWLQALAALMMCVSAPCAAASVDCGPTPTVKCLASAVFSLAKTLPEDGYFRKHVEFAEQELAPGDIKIALEYEIADAPDAPPWEDIDWIAKAGRFDRAIQLARQRADPATRLGGLLAVAAYLLDRNDTTRASKIVDEVERDLRSIQGDTDDYASLIPHEVGRLRARLGQTERAALLLSGSDEGSINALLDVAKTYPAAASLREQAWREAENVNKPYVWQLIVEDAVGRNDQADIQRGADRAVASFGDRIADHSDSAISLAGICSKPGCRSFRQSW